MNHHPLQAADHYLAANARSAVSRMNTTGIGFAGIDGVWWLPAAEPFHLLKQMVQEIGQIGSAIFALLDVVSGLYGQNEQVTALLDYKVPSYIPKWMGNGRILSLRPDFQLVGDWRSEISDSPLFNLQSPIANLHLVATELEICPSAQGFAHAMQVAYGLKTDLVESFAWFLNGRTLLFVGTHQWSEFLFEQLAFCRALAEVRAKGQVLYDVPIDEIARLVRAGDRWQPPMFGVKEKTTDWNDDIIGRIQAHSFEPYLYQPSDEWPESIGDAVVFRFGYFDCFEPEKLAYFDRWQADGATLLNPTQFILESKSLLATLQLPTVRKYLPPATLTLLDHTIPETLVLQPDTTPRITAEKDRWVIKFAGFDGGNQAWGGRSLQIGRNYTPESWQNVLQESLELPWPVVAQRFTPSVQVDIPYLDNNHEVQVLQEGHTRLRVFLLRENGRITPCGSHLTVSSHRQVSEGTNAIQTPVIYD